MTPDAPLAPEPGRATRLLRGIALLALLAFLAALAIQRLSSVDVWWQLRTGQWIAEHAAVPVHDEFSFTVHEHAWIEMRWLYCLLIRGLWALGGPALLILGAAATLAAAFALVSQAAPRTRTTPVGLAILALGIAAGSGRFVVRPELVTYLLVAVFLLVLDAARTGRARRALWLLPLLQVLWTNAHTLFVLGPVLTGLFLGSELLLRWRRREPLLDRRLAAVFLATVVACFVNPYGARGAAFPFLLYQELQRTHVFGTSIEEFVSPFALPVAGWSWNLWAAVLLTVVCALSFAWNGRRTQLSRLAVWISGAILASLSLRNCGLYAFLATWATLGNCEELGPRFRAGGFLAPAKAYAALALASLAAAWYVASDRYQVRMNSAREFGLGVVERQVPRDAVEFLLAAAPARELYHSMGDGAYLIWSAAERYPVLLDGRLEVYGEGLIQEVLQLPSHDWNAFADAHRIQTALLETGFDDALVRRLRQDPTHWVLVHVDARNVVYVRNTPEHAALIERYRIDPLASWSPRAPEADETTSGWRRWIGGVSPPWRSLGLAKTFLLLGGIDNAERYARRACERCPTDLEARVLLAQFQRARGHAAEAEELLAGIDLTPELANWADGTLINVSMTLGRPAEALAPLVRRAQRSGDGRPLVGFGDALLARGDAPTAARVYDEATRFLPQEPEVWLRAARAHEQANELEAALQACRSVTRLRPPDPALWNQIGQLQAKLGRSAEARASFESALRLDPSYAPARENLGRSGGR